MSCKNTGCHCSGACTATRTFPSDSYGTGSGNSAVSGYVSTVTYPWGTSPLGPSITNPSITPWTPYPNTIPYTPSVPSVWPPYDSGTTVTWTTPPSDSKRVYIVLANLSITSDIIDVLTKCRTIAGEKGEVIVGIPMITEDQFEECEKLFGQLRIVDEVTLHNEYTLASEDPDVFVITRCGDYSVKLTLAEDEYIKNREMVVLQFVELPVLVPVETTTVSKSSKEMLLG